MSPASEVLAVIPAAGRALRLGLSATSKEVLSIGDRLACQDLLEAIDLAGIRHGLLLTRSEKLDVASRIATLPLQSLRLATLLVPATRSMPHTLDHAWPFLRRRRIALGFPDVLLEPATVFQELLARGDSGEADVVLALFPAAEPARSDLVATNAEGRVLEVVVKRPESRLRRTWMAAVWSPRFTDHLHRSLAGPPLAGPRKAGGAEVQLGELIQSALGAGLAVDAVDFPGGAALDIGTPKSLARARLGALGRQTPHPQAPKTARDERS